MAHLVPQVLQGFKTQVKWLFCRMHATGCGRPSNDRPCHVLNYPLQTGHVPVVDIAWAEGLKSVAKVETLRLSASIMTAAATAEG